MKESYIFLLILVPELQNQPSEHILSLMQSYAMHLLGHQLQNIHKKVPGRVDRQNKYFREVLLLVCGYIYLCVYFLCLQCLLFACGFVPVQEKVNLGTRLSGGFEEVPALKCRCIFF